ncbi:MAG: ABC-ATPase domain-containing protein, partial [Firmicutes bacterium]|nr:ABC-ATPase domain-containing protein [Bacillota bacterium]
TPSYMEARFSVGLPARGRTVLGRQAIEMLCVELPKVAERSLFYNTLDKKQLRRHIEVSEDQDYLRGQLSRHRLVAFIGNGAVLPRRSGVSDRPLSGEKAVPFKAPVTLEVEFTLPNAGKVRGMGIPEGVTLIVGGGYHGKSTLLRAVERGVYNHLPGDGREYVVTLADAVKIRAEDGRRVAAVDISPFINNLPFKQDTTAFSTEEASGSTSQAANIMEYLEAGAKLLLLDEDTSATNFMIRDMRMQALVAKDKEPITPFIDRVRQLYTTHGVSTIIVIGGSGDYFDIADTVIVMDEYRSYDVTQKAKKIASTLKTRRRNEAGAAFRELPQKRPLRQGLEAIKGKKVKISIKDQYNIQYGRTSINLSFVEQLVDVSQTRAIGLMLHYPASRYFDGIRTIKEAVELLYADLQKEGLDIFSPFKGQHPGDYALARPYELIAALNRFRTLQIR